MTIVMTLTSHGTSQQGIAISHRVRRDIHEAARIHSRRFVTRAITVAEAGKRTNLHFTTMNYDLRERILKPYVSSNDSADPNFKGIPLDVVEELIRGNFLELESWNECPGVTEIFLPFLRRNPTFTAHGYVISEERDDTRVTIEGLEKDGTLTKEELIDFAMTFRYADEFELSDDYARCWYD